MNKVRFTFGLREAIALALIVIGISVTAALGSLS